MDFIDEIRRTPKALIATFKTKVRTLSTSPLCGGISDEIRFVFNYDGKEEAVRNAGLRGKNYEEHMRALAKELQLDPEHATGLLTAAQMEDAAVADKVWEDFSVKAVVTGGVEVNAGRVGDPAVWHEHDGVWESVPAGTINILLFIDAHLTKGAITRALVTCTEAKTAALWELCISSRSSGGLATGSGTDGTIIVSNQESPVHLTEAGKHCKLGEYIGKAVKEAVKEALYRQTGVGPEMQSSVFRRLERFGICEKSSLDRDMYRVTKAVLYAHLLDEIQWGLLDPKNPSVREIKEELEQALELKTGGHFVKKQSDIRCSGEE